MIFNINFHPFCKKNELYVCVFSFSGINDAKSKNTRKKSSQNFIDFFLVFMKFMLNLILACSLYYRMRQIIPRKTICQILPFSDKVVHVEKVIDRCVLSFFPFQHLDDFPFIQNNRLVAVFQCLLHVVRNHERSDMVLLLQFSL